MQRIGSERQIKEGEQDKVGGKPRNVLPTLRSHADYSEVKFRDLGLEVKDSRDPDPSLLCAIDFKDLTNLLWWDEAVIPLYNFIEDTTWSFSAAEDTAVASKYKLGDNLGEGMFGTVKLCWNRSTRKKYAVKIIDKIIVAKYDRMAQVMQELAIMKILRHRNIVELLEVLESETKVYIFMEYLDGGDLFDKITAQKRLDEETTVFYFQQLLNGVEYCHNKGICHRDLKPEVRCNISHIAQCSYRGLLSV